MGRDLGHLGHLEVPTEARHEIVVCTGRRRESPARPREPTARREPPVPSEPSLLPQTAEPAQPTRPAPTAPSGLAVALDAPSSDVPSAAKPSTSKRAQPAGRSAPAVLPEDPSPSNTDTTKTGGRLRAIIAGWRKPQDEDFASAAEPAKPVDQPWADTWDTWKSLRKLATKSSAAPVAVAEPPLFSEPPLKPQTAQPAQPSKSALTAPSRLGVALDAPSGNLPSAARHSSSKRAQTAGRSAPAAVLLED